MLEQEIINFWFGKKDRITKERITYEIFMLNNNNMLIFFLN